ncbi:dolichyl-phosphate-mannose--protein mannosyltransferase [Streptomyces sp. NBC_01197]|uniref:dolichyl-phosphate-mannose--protein mannosyltransferase n=1 Tax=Streptomyces sp. NBC_01197 TaxID=2903768 RepID=UPI002E0D21EA|nr:phospholipid carrier-dependent glycosyltransferase [Streptomyces sp. NBC_01197]
MTSTAPQALKGHDAGEQPPAWGRRLRRFGYADPRETGLRERLVPPYASPGPQLWTVLGLSPTFAERLLRWSAWGGPLLVTLVAGVLRFWHLGSPHAVIFDETYYAKDAWALIHQGYEGHWPDSINNAILANPSHVSVPSDPGYVVHPPIGKWLIGIGEHFFGFTPFGWRFMTALLGTLSVLMICRIGRRLLRSTFLGCLAGALLTVDGLHFVMSRTSLLDLIVMFFVVAAFGALLIDRDRSRARLAAALPAGEEGGLRPDSGVASTLRLGARPWRIAAGVLLGLSAATKWNGLYVLVFFAVMSVLWDVGARRTAGAVRPYRAVLRHDLLPAFVSTVPVAVVTYMLSWTGWFVTKGGYFRDWANQRAGLSPDHVKLPVLGTVHLPQFDMSWVPASLRSFWHYEAEVYSFHVNLTEGHQYQSNPWSWLVVGRPVSYFYESPKPGADGCPRGGESCAREVLAIGTPLLWWAACFAVLYILWRWAFRRDWRAGAVACGIAAGYLPWFMYQQRTIFFFYAVVFVPFLCLAVAMMIGAILGPPGSSERRRAVGAIGAGVLVLLIVWNFIYFWPLFTGDAIPLSEWNNRMWLNTWI